MNKKVISLLLALLMLASLSAGCNKKVTVSPTPSAGATASQTPAASAAPTPGAIKLPITDTLTTFTAWLPSTTLSTTAGMKSANDSKAYQEAEKRTNIHINWQHPTSGNEQENFNLIVASQSYPDTLIAGSGAYYIGGFDKYIDDGIIIDLTDIIKNNAPNYGALRVTNDDIRRRTMTDVGRLPYFRTINKTVQPSFFGNLVRQDLLNAAGYKGLPETYTEFHDMLAALKGKAKIAPLYLFQKTGLEEQLMTGYGVNGSWYQVNGKVKFGPIESGFKDYVNMMATWYKEGLVDPEFYSRPGIFAGDTANILNGDFGVFFHFYTMIDVLEMQAADKSFNLSAVTPPVVNKGDKRMISYYNIPSTLVGGGNATISTSCKDPATLAKWFDYFYTPDGSLLGNYGIEGESFVFVNNKPVFSDLVLKNPNGLAFTDAMQLYTITQFHPKWYDWEREMTPTMSDKAKAAGSVWDKNFTGEENLPDISVSSNESAEYSAIYTDISTLINESVPSFISGKKPMSEFDAFVNQIKSMNIARAMEIQQAALDRYYKR